MNDYGYRLTASERDAFLYHQPSPLIVSPKVKEAFVRLWLTDPWTAWPARFTLFPRWDAFWKKVGR